MNTNCSIDYFKKVQSLNDYKMHRRKVKPSQYVCLNWTVNKWILLNGTTMTICTYWAMLYFTVDCFNIGISMVMCRILRWNTNTISSGYALKKMMKCRFIFFAHIQIHQTFIIPCCDAYSPLINILLRWL